MQRPALGEICNLLTAGKTARDNEHFCGSGPYFRQEHARANPPALECLRSLGFVAFSETGQIRSVNVKVESEPDQRRNPISASDSNAMHEDDIRHIVRNGIGRDTRVHPQAVDACPPALNPASRWLPHR